MTIPDPTAVVTISVASDPAVTDCTSKEEV